MTPEITIKKIQVTCERQTGGKEKGEESSTAAQAVEEETSTPLTAEVITHFR